MTLKKKTKLRIKTTRWILLVYDANQEIEIMKIYYLWGGNYIWIEKKSKFLFENELITMTKDKEKGGIVEL